MEAGGSGGGGAAPATPSSVTAPTPASNWVTYGGTGNCLAATGNFALWKTWGFTGHCGSFEGSKSGFTQTWKGSTASGDTTPGVYDYQRAYEGFGVTAINGGGTGLGIFKAHAADPTIKAGITTSLNPVGGVSDTAVTGASANKLGAIATFLKFAGGSMLLLDLESPGSAYTAGTNAQWYAYGYLCGTAIWGTPTFAALELLVYDWQGYGCWNQVASNYPCPAPYNPTPAAAELHRSQFMYGIFSAHKDTNATGRIRFIDAFFYRGVQYSGATIQTALKWNVQGRLASISQDLYSAGNQDVWSHIAPLFDITPFSWAGTDSTTYYTGSQENQPTYTNNLEQYRRYGMGGMRAEFCFSGSLPGTPGRSSTENGQGLWAGGNNYLTPSGRITGMQAAGSTDASYSTTAPVLTASVSGSGSSRTVSGTLAHELGAARVKVLTYPSGSPVYAQMTHNLGGGTPTTGIANSYMDWTCTLTGVTTGGYGIVTGYSGQNQEKSLVIGPF